MPEIRGKLVDNQTRCEHWHGPTDIIALKFKCCPQMFYSCYECHQELTSHEVEKFDLAIDPDVKCILCGNCRIELTFTQYSSSFSSSSSTPNLQCPNCHHQFNNGCKLHYHYYFENIPPSTLSSCQR